LREQASALQKEFSFNWSTDKRIIEGRVSAVKRQQAVTELARGSFSKRFMEFSDSS